MQYNSYALSTVTALYILGESFIFIDDIFWQSGLRRAVLQSVIGNCILDSVCVCICISIYLSIFSKLNEVTYVPSMLENWEVKKTETSSKLFHIFLLCGVFLLRMS